jgi:serine O-acetyltransferase
MRNTPDKDKMEKLAEAIVSTYGGDTGINFIDVTNLPVREKILDILDLLIELLFPGYTGRRTVTRKNIKFIVGDILCRVQTELAEQIELALRHQCRLKNCPADDCKTMAGQVTEDLLNRLPAIRQMLRDDVQAAYDGDPAAKSFEEIVISYPYIITIAIHRIAHELYLKEVPLIPRIMSESAHSKTGIDIHPGAKIGKTFFIDHGTGVVIGETTIIGNNVKLYQGVTLGAMSFPKDARGRIIKGGKRHPTIEDNVTIYAEATILGDITIGAGATISGNAWIKKSVPPGVTVAVATPRSLYAHPEQHKGQKNNEDKK